MEVHGHRLDNGELVELRAATEADEPFLWEMLYLALYVPSGRAPFPRSVLRDPAIARYVEGWGTQFRDTGLIAVVRGSPVGAAWLRWFHAANTGYRFVDEETPELSIAVRAEHRGKGVGSLLLKQLLTGVPAASLSCDPANPAWRLYILLGFKPLPDGRTMLRTAPPQQVAEIRRPGDHLCRPSVFAPHRESSR